MHCCFVCCVNYIECKLERIPVAAKKWERYRPFGSIMGDICVASFCKQNCTIVQTAQLYKLHNCTNCAIVQIAQLYKLQNCANCTIGQIAQLCKAINGEETRNSNPLSLSSQRWRENEKKKLNILCLKDLNIFSLKDLKYF